MLFKADLAFPILRLIFLTHFPSYVIVWPRYVKHNTCSTTCPSNSMFTLDTTAFLLMTIGFVFLKFIFMPNSFLASFTRVARCWSSGPESAINAVLSTYLRLLTFSSLIETPSSGTSALNTISVNRLKRYDDRTHPCRVPRFIVIFFEFSFSVLTTASCSYVFSVHSC